MIVSSGTKKPKIHSSAYVAPSATISGDVTIGPGCAVLHGAVVVAEGAPVTIGSETVIMENAVLKASGGSALQFPLSVGDRCIVGPHAYVVGATIGNGCFLASGCKVFNGATLEDGSGVALGGIVHVNTTLPKGASVP
ncbi:MAG: gamma carbonic anhydrase family protein, partial [Candidatus Eremiobacteraeota bacterium]|nr:gamma carbonic anhydrase family protein [Candidatus Eremiobacteraeota bacterium]